MASHPLISTLQDENLNGVELAVDTYSGHTHENQPTRTRREKHISGCNAPCRIFAKEYNLTGVRTGNRNRMMGENPRHNAAHFALSAGFILTRAFVATHRFDSWYSCAEARQIKSVQLSPHMYRSPRQYGAGGVQHKKLLGGYVCICATGDALLRRCLRGAPH